MNRGEFNSATTRVLHYVLNPEAEARKEQAAARIGELEAEIAVLRVQLQKCGQGVGSQAAGPQVSRPAATVLEAEIVVLQQKVGRHPSRASESLSSNGFGSGWRERRGRIGSDDGRPARKPRRHPIRNNGNP